MEGGQGMFKKGVPVEVLEVKEDEVARFEYKLGELGARGGELVTGTPHVGEVEPPLFQALTAFDSTTKVRVRTHGYTLVFKRPLGPLVLKALNKAAEKVNLSWANLSGANLADANLSAAVMHRAYLSEADLRNADLRGADLSEADLSMAKLNGAYLGAANLRGADLSEANLHGAYLHEAIYEHSTILPEGFDPEEAGMVLVE